MGPKFTKINPSNLQPKHKINTQSLAIWQCITHYFNLLKPSGYMDHQVHNLRIDILPTLYSFLAQYNILWLVFIIESLSLYCSVQTGPINTAVCTWFLKGSYMYLSKQNTSFRPTQNTNHKHVARRVQHYSLQSAEGLRETKPFSMLEETKFS